MLDLNLLLAFEAMLLEQNVTAAAARMALTQSAMSNALGRLRQAFDDPLFVKTRSGMLPTSRALELAHPLRAALVLVRSATERAGDFDPLRSERLFRFHMSDVGELVFLPRLMARLRKIGATVQVETAQLAADEVGKRLASGEIDFAAGYLPALARGADSVSLFREHYVCLTRKGGAGSHGSADKLSLKRFLAAAHVAIASMGSGHAVIERTLERRGLKRHIALRVPHFVVIPTIVAETDLLVTVPSRVATSIATRVKVDIHPLPIAIPPFDVALYWHRRFAADAGSVWMRGLMVDLYRQPAPGRRQDP